jgi:predicted alpha-1,2-mannosidase
VSSENAWQNLKAELPGWDFDQVRADANRRWNHVLGRILVDGGSERDKKVFYTALYHSLLHPNLSSDVNGQYLGFDGAVHSGTHYANFSGWDIYRSQIQLLALLFPERTGEIVQSLIEDAGQCGALPKWANNNDETGIMVGDPGPILVANAFAFGADHFDQQSALALMAKSALVPGTRCNGHEIRPHLKDYLERGFIPQEVFSLVGWSSTLLEYASSDFAISRYARALGDPTLAASVFSHSANWKNIFDQKSGLIRPKLGGGWLTPFSASFPWGFTEGNSAQYSWMIPFDVASEIEFWGGNSAAIERLDSFTTRLNAYMYSPHLWIGNEPGFLAPWLYDWMGASGETQKLLARIRTESFSDEAGGLPGNDDLGATSSWYVWNVLGLYPAIPGVGGFAVSQPAFPRIRIHLESGGLLELATHSQGVIQALEIDGSTWGRSWIPWEILKDGARLSFELGPAASSWAASSDGAPPSFARY